MTFEEVKELLMRSKRTRAFAKGIQQNINSLSLYRSSLSSSDSIDKGKASSPVEQAVTRIEKEKEKLATTLMEIFDLEDKLLEAIDTLEPSERHIIEGSFLRSQTHWQLANEMGYSVETIKRHKKKAISKIADNIKR